MTYYTLQGITSEGETFDFPGVRFNTYQEAVDYAMTYARCVTGTDSVYPSLGSRTIKALGLNYSETITIEEAGR